MAKRKSLPKSIRFEVLKRDSFTCQYCGKSAPEVILEVDHINPKSRGGNDDVMNLITSCRDCNRGKSNRKLDDNSVISVQKRHLDELQARRENMEMMLEWRKELSQLEEIQIDAISEYLDLTTGRTLTDSGRGLIRKHLRKFDFSDVYDAVGVSVSQYYRGSDADMEIVISKIGGICGNWKKWREYDAEQNH